MIDNFFNALGSTSGGPDAANTGNVTNIFAKEVISGEQEYDWTAGLHFDENPMGYTEIPIEDQGSTGEPAEESNHSIKILTDSMAVYEVLTKLDPAMDVERFYDIFQRAANTPHKSLEALVDGLSALLGIDAEPLPVGSLLQRAYSGNSGSIPHCILRCRFGCLPLTKNSLNLFGNAPTIESE